MKKKEIKLLSIIIVISLLIIAIYYLLFAKKEVEDDLYNANIIIDGNRFINYENKQWNDIKTIETIKMDNFKVYVNNTYTGDYLITETNNKIYFFDSDYNSHKIGSSFIAISKESKMSIIDYKTTEINNKDNDIIDNYLKSKKINYNGVYSTKSKYVTDLNNDNKDDYIYILCNELYSKDVFYIIFARIGNKNITIINQKSNNNINRYELAWILNTNNNKYHDLVLKKPVTESYDYYLYSYIKENKYSEILSN